MYGHTNGGDPHAWEACKENAQPMKSGADINSYPRRLPPVSLPLPHTGGTVTQRWFLFSDRRPEDWQDLLNHTAPPYPLVECVNLITCPIPADHNATRTRGLPPLGIFGQEPAPRANGANHVPARFPLLAFLLINTKSPAPSFVRLQGVDAIVTARQPRQRQRARAGAQVSEKKEKYPFLHIKKCF